MTDADKRTNDLQFRFANKFDDQKIKLKIIKLDRDNENDNTVTMFLIK